MKAKRFLSAVTSAVMLLSLTMTYAAETVTAEETAKSIQTTTENTDIQGGNSLSKLILGAAESDASASKSADAQESDDQNRVSNIVIEKGKAEVTYNTQT